MVLQKELSLSIQGPLSYIRRTSKVQLSPVLIRQEIPGTRNPRTRSRLPAREAQNSSRFMGRRTDGDHVCGRSYLPGVFLWWTDRQSGADAAMISACANGFALLRFSRRAGKSRRLEADPRSGKPIFAHVNSYAQFPIIWSLLRDESQVSSFPGRWTLASYITTAVEPVGEGESSEPARPQSGKRRLEDGNVAESRRSGGKQTVPPLEWTAESDPGCGETVEAVVSVQQKYRTCCLGECNHSRAAFCSNRLLRWNDPQNGFHTAKTHFAGSAVG